ncbi:hypothetical protein [Paenibacillus sp. J2TS4]|uniref:hypothetical protein n=1 Tax=Paenibacillus sp. J2TS4 TaxID=2807194 RepID=UPI001B1F445E|nr:hypothetical protein [Paenibacillus sp. J2TS4]GIP34633.1 hypothetical protein J2TS4_38430 [Paenibacillus sp. J2TS4]
MEIAGSLSLSALVNDRQISSREPLPACVAALAWAGQAYGVCPDKWPLSLPRTNQMMTRVVQ